MPSKTSKTIDGTDFNVADLSRKSDAHDESLQGLKSSVEALNNRVGSDENFGKAFASAEQESVSLRKAVATSIVDALKNDKDTRAAVAQLVTEVDGRFFKKQIWTILKFATWIVSIIVTVILTNVANSILK